MKITDPLPVHMKTVNVHLLVAAVWIKHIDAAHLKLKYHLCDHCDFTAFSKNISRLHAAKEHGTSDLKSFAAIFKEKSEAESFFRPHSET